MGATRKDVFSKGYLSKSDQPGICLGLEMNVSKINRRTFLTISSAAFAGPLWAAEDDLRGNAPLGIPMRQEPLAFDLDALEPYLDAATLKLHYHSHHADVLGKFQQTLRHLRLTVGNAAALMRNMSDIVLPPDTRQKTVPMGGPPRRPSPEAQQSLRMYGGGHVNHTVFWRFLVPPGTGPSGPEGKAADAITKEFGSVEAFKKQFSDAALRHFGSGWAWLVYRADGRLVITTTNNEDNPLMRHLLKADEVGRPILCLDLWEHAYYARYKNDRKKYIEAWWNVVNWGFFNRAYGIVTSIGRI